MATSPPATSLSALFQIGPGFTDEVPALGDFSGSANGTILASNIGTSFTGNHIDFQLFGSSVFKIDYNGITTISTTTQSTSTTSGALKVSGGIGVAKNIYTAGNIHVGTGTFTSAASNDILMDNGTTDTPGIIFYHANSTNIGIDVASSTLRLVKDLNESTGSVLWSINRNGVVTQTGWRVGETIKTQMYNNTDLSFTGNPTVVSSTTYVTIATASFTPLSSSSYLWIEFSCTYSIAGTAGDDWWSNIEVGAVEQVNANQVWTNASGGGTRSGVLFPLAARYTNSGTSTLTITVRVKRGSSDDNGSFYGNAGSAYMRIQEIGR